MKKRREIIQLTYDDCLKSKDYYNFIKTDVVYKFLKINKMSKKELSDMMGIALEDLELLLSEKPGDCFDWTYKLGEIIGIEGSGLMNL